MGTLRYQAPFDGRFELKVLSGGASRWVRIEYAVRPLGAFRELQVTLAPGVDGDAARWFPFVREGALEAAGAWDRETGDRPQFALEITGIVAHPVDTDEAVCRRRGARLVRELCAHALRGP